MNICLFYHSVISDWNHGNAHFLRGMVTALMASSHEVTIFEPLNGWSFTNMLADVGIHPICEFNKRFPKFQVKFYNETTFSPDVLNNTDMVIVHEWNSPELIRKIGEHKKTKGKYILLFHDTHHRSLTDSENMEKNDLSGYNGVLAFGEVIKDIYLENKWAETAWTWHEAADTTIFRPLLLSSLYEGDLVWIGNWGDNERSGELFEFIINPVKELGLKAKFYGVGYPPEAIKSLKNAAIEYGGWLPNYKVPEIFSKYKVTIHVPRRPYAEKLPGIPTIRPFEAMACGIPLISSTWNDTERLFRKNMDYLMVDDGAQMKQALKKILANKILRGSMIFHGLATIYSKHTCRHRVNELLNIYNQIHRKTSKEITHL